ncbi:MAG: DNA mismatch repair protein MutS [Pseudomonadota bacterium]
MTTAEQRSGEKHATPRVTPMMRQYLEAKATHPDALLLFRMGDFYEMFFEDAVTASQVLDLTLTSRDRDKGDDAIPMAGFPHHAASSYIPRLVEQGIKVAVCDQVEDPKLAKGLVKREITRLVTAGTTLDEVSLDARRNNYLAALCELRDETTVMWGLCALDVSTGEIAVQESADAEDLVEALDRLGVAELLVAGEVTASLIKRIESLDRRRRLQHVDLNLGRALDAEFLAQRWPEGQSEAGAAAQAARSAVAYVLQVQRGRADQIGTVRWDSPDAHLVLDAATRRHLDLLQNNVDGKRRGSLLGAVDQCVTAMGSRRCARWLVAPSRVRAVVEARLDAVQALWQAPVTRQDLRDLLRHIPDLERLAARVAAGHASPRDLGALRDGLLRVPEVQILLQPAPALADLASRLEPLGELQEVLAHSLVDEPPAQTRDGRFVRPGHDAEIDRLSRIAGGAKDALAAIEHRERERTGIPSLKVRYNKVFGYFIEVTRTHLAKVPVDWIRKQTIANGERFITEELKTLEDEILHADERRLARELALFEALCGQVTLRGPSLRRTAGALGEIDALAGFAETAARHSYCRPEIHDDDDRALFIEEGRHPVVEQLSRELGEPFVPNDVELDCKDRQVLVMTGPNMAGKSTIMRQVALIQVLAQAGSFVPATRARLALCDRVFTRVGASDDVSRGRSTFMVEMIETARILHGASRASLVLLDEIGRGTSTFDGLAIAWAVTEYLHDTVGARTVFATHYHELTELARLLPRVHNVHVAVKEWNDEVHFIRRLLDGCAERSYGIQVARLANLPSAVLDRAKEVLAQLEKDAYDDDNLPRLGRVRGKPRASSNQLNLFGAPPAGADPLRKKLRPLDLDRITPLQAMSLLAELKALLDKDGP